MRAVDFRGPNCPLIITEMGGKCNGKEERQGRRDHPKKDRHPLGQGVHLLGGPADRGPRPGNRQADPAVFHRQDTKGSPGEDAGGGGVGQPRLVHGSAADDSGPMDGRVGV